MWGNQPFLNRLVEQRQAIMDDEPGVTRDRHYGYSEWCGKYFTVIDTGGYVTGSEDKFESQIRKQVEMGPRRMFSRYFLCSTAGRTDRVR